VSEKKSMCIELFFKLTILTVGGFIMSSCGRVQNNPVGLGNNNLPQAPANVQAIFTQSCATAGCHVQGGGIFRLDAAQAYTAIVGVQSSRGMNNKNLVTAGDTTNSYLLDRMKGIAPLVGIMPPGGMLSPQKISVIANWIQAGAPSVLMPVALVATIDSIQTAILTPKCAGCHFPNSPIAPPPAPRFQDVSNSYNTLVGVQATGNSNKNRVTANDTLNSYLVDLVKGMGVSPVTAMPPVGNPLLSPAEVQLITSWIMGGALPSTKPPVVVNLPPTLDNIQAMTFTPGCVSSGCHDIGAAGGLRLDYGNSYASLVGQLASGAAKNRVTARDTLNSYLLDRIQGLLGTIMPPSGTLGQSQINQIKNWILAGALPDSSVKQVVLPPTLDNIQATILTPSCATSGCHDTASNAGGLKLDYGNSYASLIGITATKNNAKIRVTPGDSTNSYLVDRIKGLDGIMPQAGSLVQGQISQIANWIQAGAAPDSSVSLTPTFSVIQTTILTPSCAISGCHLKKGDASFRLDNGKSYAKLVGIPALKDATKNRVTAGDTTNSYLLDRLNGIDGIMPPAPAMINQTQINLIANWILAGAQNN